MSETRYARFVTIALLAIACRHEEAPIGAPGEPLPRLLDAELADFRVGAVLFNRVYTASEGLGPLFNENQCSACHTDPAAGGSGGTRVLRATRFVSPDSCDRLESKGGENIRSQATPAAKALGVFRESVPPEATAQARFAPPALFGLGLVELIPEQAILARADPTDADGDGISGRPGQAQGGTLGRFGRKAETATLLEFTAMALHLEMGLTSPLAPREAGVQGGPLPAGTDPTPDPEVDSTALAQLVTFVRYLAPPAPANRGRAHRDSVHRGERVFEGLGCAACHVRSMKSGSSPIGALNRKTVVLYSDLLLHDMGSGLADVCGRGAQPVELRTEMLVGLRHRDTFLHHGRTTTLVEAIMQHGGEAQTARDAFAALPAPSRAFLLTFLKSL
jgi:CxxC motif-containing protein (DUF1111 family)